MKLPNYCSPEEFATWLSKQVATNGGKLPTETEWEEIKKRLENAIEWVHPWYLKPSGDDGDGGGGRRSYPSLQHNRL